MPKQADIAGNLVLNRTARYLCFLFGPGRLSLRLFCPSVIAAL
jgi:hypothetical protein